MNFLTDIIEHISTNISSASWWGEELPSWLVFTGLVSLLLRWHESRRYQREREPYEGWTLQLIGYGDALQGLDPDEVRRFLNSKFEFWKFAKSAASSTHDLTLRGIDGALDRWVVLDRSGRRISIDLTKIVPLGHGKLKPSATEPTIGAPAPAAGPQLERENG